MLCVFAAGMLLIQSCGEVALTGMSVNSENIVLPVGESIRIKVTYMPSDADDVHLTWSSSNTGVATVDNSGVVAVVGVGTAVITVSSGAVSKTVAVEGMIKTLTVTAPAGTNIRVGAEFTLTATPDPADAQVTVVWSSDNAEVVAVNASTGEVTVAGSGTATITAAAGIVTGSYTIVCEDMLASAVGYWEFDDPDDIGKAIRGGSLTRRGDGIKSAEGPSADNLAVEAPMHEYFIATLSAVPNGGPEGETHSRVYKWSLMLDFRLPTVNGYYYTQHGGVNMGDGDFFVRYSNDRIDAGKGSYIPIIDGDPTRPYTEWIRMVITFDNGVMRMYCNGAEVAQDGGAYPPNQGIDARYSLPVNEPLYLFGEPNGTNADGSPNFAASDDDSPFPCAAIAFWDRTLNAGQVQSLGGIAH